MDGTPCAERRTTTRNRDSRVAGRTRTPTRRVGAGVRWCAVCIIAAAAIVWPISLVSAQSTDADIGGVDITRFGAADRYSTSLLIAEAFATRVGESIDDVVLVSGQHWYDAVIAAPFAARLGAPVVMTPPGGLRADTLTFLKRVNAKRVHAVMSGNPPDTTISPAVFAQLEDEGFATFATPGVDRYANSVHLGVWLSDGGLGSLGDSGTSAIIASGEVFADALVAGPAAAKAQVPILLTPRSELHADVEKFLRAAKVSHVVLMGGTAALSAEVETSVRDLGITQVDRIAGASRFETATQFAGHTGAKLSDGCSGDDHVGLARGDVPFDSFSAAPLLAQLCAPLLLTSPDKLPDATITYLSNTGERRRWEYIEQVRRTARNSDGSPRPQLEAIGLSVFGGSAAVSDVVLSRFADLTVPSGDLADVATTGSEQSGMTISTTSGPWTMFIVGWHLSPGSWTVASWQESGRDFGTNHCFAWDPARQAKLNYGIEVNGVGTPMLDFSSGAAKPVRVDLKIGDVVLLEPYSDPALRERNRCAIRRIM